MNYPFIFPKQNVRGTIRQYAIKTAAKNPRRYIRTPKTHHGQCHATLYVLPRKPTFRPDPVLADISPLRLTRQRDGGAYRKIRPQSCPAV
tara:strand:+ start:48984 stop:49253 length:270 start_codon:yes stop_codon:yes gene_type:complete